MKTIVIEFETLEELKKLVSDLEKKELEDDKNLNERYDNFIYALFKLVTSVVDDGTFTKDALAYEEFLHKDAPIDVKRAFFKNFSKECEDIVSTIMELTSEFIAYHIVKEEPKAKPKSKKSE